MWTTTTRLLNFNGSLAVLIESSSPPIPLKSVRVDVYRFSLNQDGTVQFNQLNQVAARTTITGDFNFSNLPVSVQVQEVIPGSPPYTPVEITNPASQPNLAFRISVEAEVLTAGTSQGNQFVDIYDERPAINQSWVASHPERLNVPLAGSPALLVLIPEGNEVATTLAGITLPATTVLGTAFHFLRVGRTIRQEIGEVGDARSEFVGKTGYMNSSNTWASPQPSFFPHVVDAPFGSTLQIGGQFGADFLTPPLSDNLYYTVSFGEYSGSLASPFNPALLTSGNQIIDPLFNKCYLLPTAALPNGQWQTLNLGPFSGTITAVERPHAPSLIGTTVMVYKRPGLPNLATEYWPFWDLMTIWNSTAAPNSLVILTLEAYEKVGGTDADPELKKRVVTSSVNDHLPLHIDNRPPVLKLLELETGFATFSPENVTSIWPFDPCGEMPVTLGQVNSNECILVRYSVEDGAGLAHPHVASYGLQVEFTRRGGLSTNTVSLKSPLPPLPPFGAGLTSPPHHPSTGYKAITDHYSRTLSSAPMYNVQNFKSVLVPNMDDGWPPEPNGDPPSPCVQYAAAVTLGCSVRTVDGWSKLFGDPSARRFIIIKR